MANGAIGIPDTSQLPIQSNLSQYDLRNAAAAFSPQPTAPPGAIGTPAPGSIEDLQQRSLESFQNPGQYVPEVPQEFQQPQFLPQAPDPLEQAKQTILGRIQDRQQQNMQRGSRIKNLLTNFLHGAGEGMMVHAGLETPEQAHQRDLGNLLAISNAQANQGLKDVEAQRYMLDVQKVPILGPDGQPLRDAEGNVQLYPRWQAAIQQQHVNKLAEQKPPKVELNELYASSVQNDLAKGLRGPSPRTLQLRDSIQAAQKPPADISPDRETFNYYTRPKEQGGAGLSPAQAYSAMHPRQNLTMGSTDVKDIADAIESGDQPPTLTGLYRNAAPVRAELARRGVPIARMEMDWQATKKYMGTLNGPQQVRLRQAIETAGDSLDKIQGLYDEWQKLAPVSGFKIANHAALVAMKNLPGRTGAVANSLDAQIADLTSELGNVYMGGNSPTDHSLKLAQQNLSSDWGPQAFEEAMKQARLNIGIRKNSITHGAPAGVPRVRTNPCLRFLTSISHAEILVLTGVLLSTTAGFSDTIYSNTSLTGAVTALSTDLIVMDDVLVPSSRDPSHGPLSINSITVHITVGAGGVGTSTQFGIYLFPVNSDGTPIGSPALVGNTSVTFTSSSQLVTFGGAGVTLFKVNPNFTAQPGFGLFYIGLTAEGGSTQAFDWTWANGPDANLPTSYTYVVGTGQLFVNNSPPGFPPNWSYYAEITGTPVPEPTTLAMLGTGIAGIMWKKYKAGSVP